MPLDCNMGEETTIRVGHMMFFYVLWLCDDRFLPCHYYI